ncbi:MAG TPA: GAF domain-containing sensor histidine kinase [Micromonosporaceae bacterium]|nr:GAF domain-containing sensor histidine kinase [Micromonosporaceae bacterium]
MTSEAVPSQRPEPTAIAARLILLAVVTAMVLVATRDAGALVWLVLLCAAAVPAALLPGDRFLGPLARLAEVVVTGLAAWAVADQRAAGVPAGMAAAAVLPYLLVPVVAATLYRRRGEAVALIAVAAALLAGTGLAAGRLDDAGYLTAVGEWLVLATLAAAVAGALQQRLMARQEAPQPYAEATRLLTQLRSVARQLPGATLDPGGLAEHLLDDVRAVAPASRAAVLSASGGGRLVVLAQYGADRVDWETALDTESAIADAWASQQPATANRSQARSAAPPGTDVSALVVPLVAGVRTIGLVAMETDAAMAYPAPVVARVAAMTTPAALRLEAALLFDEVRSLATTEERQRLAREIHDGVAQELVMVGYGIDNALATLPDVESAADDLRALRGEVTRVITELRLSLFELRSEVERYGGLAAAIADYARTVGASAGLRVHLSLDESTARLPSATEAELLRIAQEAITNARKHAGAENLWVTCAVDPPFAQVEVSDDGSGIGDQRPDGRYGLAIMAERAERIRGRLEINPRKPNGTTVAVVLGTAPRRGSV